MTTCSLCDLPTPQDPHTDPDVAGSFCCQGCLTVARSLDGVSDAEDLKAERAAAPSSPTEEFDGETTFLHVDGMHCATCETFLEVTASGEPGVAAVEASYATDTVRIDFDPDVVSAEELPDLLSVAGYTASPRSDPDPDGDDADVVRFLVGGGFFGMMTMLWYVVFLYPTYFGYEPLLDLGSLSGLYLFAHIWVFTSVVLFYTGYPILRGAYVSLRARQPNMDLLVALAALSSYAYSTLAMAVGRTDLYFDVTVTVILVVIAGNHYESRIKRRATGLISDLTTRTETTVRRASGETVASEEVEAGDRLLVRPGERVPFDGTVVDGTAAVDEALVTGESLPVTKRAGDEVRGGTVVTDDPLVVEVGDEATSTLDTLVRLLWEIQSSRSGVQRLVDRLATVFVPLVIALAIVTTGALLVTGTRPTTAALVGLTVVIVSCPCALGLASPLAVASGVRDAAKRGIVVVSDTVFETAADVETVVLDKTGTLTDGKMTVRDVVTHEAERGEVLERAVTLERASAHPIAEAMVRASEGGTGLTTDGGSLVGTVDVTVLDEGVRGTVDGAETVVGHRSLFEDWSVPERLLRAAERAERAGNVPSFVGWNGAVHGVVVVGDEVREGWHDLAESLDRRGKRVVVLTGDSEAAARRFRDHPAVDEVFAGVPPAAKAETVRRLRRTDCVAMVGDGSNDAPALAEADLGVAVASGTDLATDAADAVILDDRLSAVVDLFDVTRGTNRRIKRNLGWAFAYNAIAIPLAVAGFLNPLLAALAMATSSILVVANSARPVTGTADP